MDSLIPGRYYKINNGSVSAYYICNVPGYQQRAILGLKPPSEILEWLQAGMYRSVYVTPLDLMAIRDSTLVTTGDGSDTNDLEFDQMLTLLNSRNKQNYTWRQEEKVHNANLEKGREAQQRAREAQQETQQRAQQEAQQRAEREASGELRVLESEAQPTGRLGNELKHLQRRIDAFITRV
jgi:hypothetical protein